MNEYLLDIFKDRQMKKILAKSGANLKNIEDLTAGEEPTLLFYILADVLGYLLENDPDTTLSNIGVKIRKKIHFIITAAGKHFLGNPQFYENREFLIKEEQEPKENNRKSDRDRIIVPDEPVIWIANHAFKDDTLATILAAKRHAYILFGSLPQFYNSFDGITSWLNGVAMTNRKVKASKKASLQKACQLIDYGSDLLLFVEGVWNKTPEKPMLDIYNGIYRIASEKGCKIMPIAHYMKDLGIKYHNPYELVDTNYNYNKELDPIHTVLDDAIDIKGMPEKEALELIRNTLASWTWLMAEKYGQSTRQEETKYFYNSKAAWEFRLKERIATVDRYDQSIERTADYHKNPSLQDIWGDLAKEPINEKNKELVNFAKKELKNDFQHRF